MNRNPRQSHDNIVQMPAKLLESRNLADDLGGRAAAAGGPDDPRMQEAMRLMEAFLAIEDAAARTALIALADRLVSHDWLRNARQS